MKKTVGLIQIFIRDERGATAIEYALLAAFLGVGIIAALRGVHSQMNGTYADLTAGMASR